MVEINSSQLAMQLWVYVVVQRKNPAEGFQEGTVFTQRRMKAITASLPPHSSLIWICVCAYVPKYPVDSASDTQTYYDQFTAV